jgi:hypothetical protein
MKWLDKYPYLYNCSVCGAKVKVKPTGEVTRKCNHTTATVNAPRKVILTGDGTLNGVPASQKFGWHFRKLLTALTGRCI